MAFSTWSNKQTFDCEWLRRRQSLRQGTPIDMPVAVCDAILNVQLLPWPESPPIVPGKQCGDTEIVCI